MKGKLKKLLTVILCMSLICNTVGMQGFVIQKAYAAEDTKITGVTEAKASSESSNPASWAVNAPLDDWWSARDPGVCWLQLTLDHTYYIDRWYVINIGKFDGWGAYTTRDYKLQGSLDGTTWTDIDSVVGNTKAITNRIVTPFSAKYVRIYITNPDQNGNVAQAYGNIVDFEVFATAPVVTSVELPSNKIYSAGDALTFNIKHAAEVTVNTSVIFPYIPVTIGTKTKNAWYKSGSGTQTLTFEYIVQNGDYDENGITLGTGINGYGAIKDFALNVANLTFNGVGGTSGIVVDARPRYSISIGTMTDGSISASVPSPYSTSAVVVGETINLNITPASGKQLKSGSLKYYDGTSKHIIADNSFVMPGANVTVSAEFEDIPPIYYNVKIGTLTDGSISADKPTATEGEKVILTVTPDTGKQLKPGSLKYNDGINNIIIMDNSFIMPASIVTITGEFEVKTCNVKFESGSTSTIPDTAVNYGGVISKPTVDISGYRQDGWYSDSNFTTLWDFSTDTVKQDMMLYLKLTPTGNVIFESYGAGDIDSQTIGIGEKIKEPAGVIKTRFILEGWYLKSDLSGDKYDFNTIVSKTDANLIRTLYAKWVPVPKYKITVGTLEYGSIGVDKETAEAGEKVTLTVTPGTGKKLKAGSLKYNDGSKNVTISNTTFTMPATAVTISAEFEAITYTVKFESDSSSSTIPDVIANHGERISKPTVSKEGYRLDGWYMDSNFTTLWNFNTDTVLKDMTLYLKLTPIGNVAFDSNGAGTVASQTVGMGEKIQKPGTINKTSYIFDGWYLQSDFNGDKYDFNTIVTKTDANQMRTLYAKWNPVLKYNVTIGTLAGGTIKTDKVKAEEGETITLTITPGTGKKLKAGSLKYNDGSKNVTISNTTFTMPATAVTISAEFEAITYTVKFESDSSSSAIPDVIVNCGEKVTKPTISTAGYRQDGWYTNNSFTTLWNFDVDTVLKDMTLYLKLTPTGNVAFDSNGAGTVASQTVGIGEKIQKPGTINKTSYIFDGWYLQSDFSGGKYDFNAVVTKTDANQMRTLYAKWTPVPKYNVTIGTLTGGTIKTDKVKAEEGETITLTITPGTGKKLKAGSLKYNDGSKNVTISNTTFTMPATAVTISAEFEAITYTVKFESDSSSSTIADVVVNCGEKVTKPTVSTAGYRQDGWYTNNSFTTLWNFDVDTVLKDMTLYQKLIPIGNVAFDSNGAGTVASQTVGMGEKIQEPTVISKTSYIFDGWYLQSDFSGGKYDFNTVVTKTDANQMRTLYAKWTPVPKYNVTIGTLTGGTIQTDKVKAEAGETITLTITPGAGKKLKAGSLKYNDGSKNVTISNTTFTMPATAVTISAEFEAITYTVKFESDNSSFTIPDVIVNCGEKVTKPTVSTAGYRQDGWYTNNSFTTLWNFDVDTVLKDMTLYLKLTPTGNVAFDSNGAGTVASQTVGMGEKIQEPAAINKTSYIFDGWYLQSDFSGGKYDFNTVVTKTEANQKRTLYAKWTPVPKYNVTIGTLTGGTIKTDKVKAEEGETITLTITPGTGKKLKAGSLKYNDGSKNVAISNTTFTMPATAVTISAEFEAVPYTVKFESDNSSFTIPDVIVNCGEKVTKPTISTAGYRQDGWYTNNSFTTLWNFDVDTVLKDMTLYQKLTPIGNVAFDSNGAGTVAPQTVGIGEKIQEPAVISKTSYIFDGWYLQSDFSGGKYGFNTVVTKTEANQMRTLYAKWVTVPKYNVSIEASGGGSITADKTTALQGEIINLTIIPESGKELKVGSLKYDDGVTVHAISGGSFNMPASSVTVKAEFITKSVVIIDKTLVSIETPISVTHVTNGTPKTAASLGLPSTVTLVTDSGRTQAIVNWDINGSSYDASVLTEQSFLVSGEVILPSGVINPSNIPLNTIINVSVKAASGTVEDKTLVSIVTPGAITGLLNGTENTATALGLPATIMIVTSDGNVNAGVTWDMASSSYNRASISAQTFTVTGMIILPIGVVNSNNLSLTITMNVSVNASSNSGSGTGNDPGSGTGNNTGNGSGSYINTPSPSVVNNPKLPQIEDGDIKGWESIAQNLKDNGRDITVAMHGNTMVEKEIFEAARGKDIEMTFVLENGVEWVINGMDIMDSVDGRELSDIDFNLTMNAGAIPSELLSTLPTATTSQIPLSLSHEGNFGFKARIIFPLGEKNNGKIANLFYYNPVTKLFELQAMDVINNEGKAELQFPHASDYVIVISNQVEVEPVMYEITATPVKKTLYVGGLKEKNTIIKTEIPEIIQNLVKDGLCKISISYESSNPLVASVSSNGKITAKKAGKVTIITIINANGAEKKLETGITVKKAYVKLTQSTNTMKLGETYRFQAVGYGISAKSIVFNTTNSSIVKINKTNGMATAQSAGTCYIIANVGKKSVKIKVTVK